MEFAFKATSRLTIGVMVRFEVGEIFIIMVKMLLMPKVAAVDITEVEIIHFAA